MARSQYGLKNTFGPGVIQQQVYNDKAKANKELAVTSVPDEVLSFHAAQQDANADIVFAGPYRDTVTSGQNITPGDHFSIRFAGQPEYIFYLAADAADVTEIEARTTDTEFAVVNGGNTVIATNIAARITSESITFTNTFGQEFNLTATSAGDQLTIELEDANSLGNNVEFVYVQVSGNPNISFRAPAGVNPFISGRRSIFLAGGREGKEESYEVGKGSLIRLINTSLSSIVVEFTETASEANIETEVSDEAISASDGVFIGPATSAVPIEIVSFIASDDHMIVYSQRSQVFTTAHYVRIEITRDL